MSANSAAAHVFHDLHRDFLILPNCWDALTARLSIEAGAKAVATSSAAVAWAKGYADGHHLPFEKLLETVREITRVVSAPVTVDMEGGYSDDPNVVGAHAAHMIEAGAVGCNIEDGVGAPETLCAKIEAITQVAAKAGVDFYINARTDVLLKKLAPPEAAVAEIIKRGKLYEAAGADGLFAPLIAAPDDIRTVAQGVPLNLNVMSFPAAPKAEELKALGARRLSGATAFARLSANHVLAAMRAFVESGDSAALAQSAGAAPDFNAWFK